MVPDTIARFGKRLDTVTELPSGRLQMNFVDGSTAEADAVIGCDGIKSRVRQLIVGKDHPSASPQYTHKYAYRGLVPMEQAIAAVGEEKAKNACMHVSVTFIILLILLFLPLTYPVPPSPSTLPTLILPKMSPY